MTVTTTISPTAQSFLTKLGPELLKITSAVETTLNSSGVKVSLETAWSIIQTALAQTVLLVEQQVGAALSGSDKKTLVLNFIQGVITTVFQNLTVPYVPAWLTSQVETYVESFLLSVAAGSIDSLVSTFQSTGVFAPAVLSPPPAAAPVSVVLPTAVIASPVVPISNTVVPSGSVVSH